MKSVKQRRLSSRKIRQFESLVNYEECKTCTCYAWGRRGFESLVNYEECKTNDLLMFNVSLFESLVNYEECKTMVQ